jgi:hypothetical protein
MKPPQLSRGIEANQLTKRGTAAGSAQRYLVLAKSSGDQRHTSMMAATMDISCSPHMMDVVAMRSLRMNRMFHRQADCFDNGWACCLL